MSLKSDLSVLDAFMKRLGYLRGDKEQYVPFKPTKVSSKRITFNRAVRLYNDNFWSLNDNRIILAWREIKSKGFCTSCISLCAKEYRLAKAKEDPYVVHLCYSKKKRKITYYGED